MHPVERIEIRGFRRLNDVAIKLRPMMVLIGANGVGKTSLLDAFSLLSASAAGSLSKTLGEMGGLGDNLTIDFARQVAFDVQMMVPGHSPLEYTLSVMPRGTSYYFPQERLSQARQGYPEPFKHIDSYGDDVRYYEITENKLLRPTWEHNSLETSLSQVPKMFPQPEELRRILATTTQYHALDVGPRAPVKLPQQMRPADMPGEDGQHLVPFLYNLRESDNARYEAIVDTLKAAFPGFRELRIPPVAAGMLAMTWHDAHFTRPVYAHQLSEGTLRFLWLVSLLQSPGLSTITMIDEPEVSLHPELLSLLADLMREASQRTHLVVATHSDSLIRFLQPNEVLVMDQREDGCAQVMWGDDMDLDKWLSDYRLDEVWRMGRMGGRS